jgi:hypothetical protein
MRRGLISTSLSSEMCGYNNVNIFDISMFVNDDLKPNC